MLVQESKLLMKLLLLAVLILFTTDVILLVQGKTKCTEPPGGCPPAGKGSGHYRWFLNGSLTCYRRNVSDCDGYGLRTLGDCYSWCVSGD
uniref:Putative kunitz n=1 Tax=Rhipicephalus microplus TaxID=6941 RepID=A0A6G5A3F1_RHIMP